MSNNKEASDLNRSIVESYTDLVESRKNTDSFELDVEIAEQHIANVIQLQKNQQEELIDHEDYLLVEALSILKKRARKYGETFTSVKDVSLYFMLELRELEKEVFKVAYLNTRQQLIETETVAIGTIDSAIPSIREIAKLALQYNASAVVLAHNHPSGNSTPSNSDKQFTFKVREALEIFDVRVLDHIIVADNTYHSMAQEGDVCLQAQAISCQEIS